MSTNSEYMKKYHAEHKNDPNYVAMRKRSKEKYKETNNAYRAKWTREDRKAHRTQYAAYELAARLRKYGTTVERYRDRLIQQFGVCAICKHLSYFQGKIQSLSVDHDHKCCDTKAKSCGACNRGLLCVSCNMDLAYLEKFLDQAQVYSLIPQPNTWLHRAVEYLKKWRVYYTETRDDGYEMHNSKCSYGLGDIGGPGCICTKKPETRT